MNDPGRALQSEVQRKMRPDLDPWPLSIATYNIHGAVGTDGRFDPARIGDVILETGADVIALQEVPLGNERTESVLKLLQQRTGFHCAAGHTCLVEGCGFGNGVLSRYPIAGSRNIDLTFGGFEPRGALDATVDCHGHPLRVVATHLGLRLAERRQQVERLLEHIDTDQMAVVLLGDLNEWFVWGHSLRRLVGHFQRAPAPRTFPSRCPVMALDRVWIRPRQRLVHVKAHSTRLARVASDHLPLVAHIGAHVEP
jgi:endonuclease/exonuclease/phosphatase family metal-dependent hydrolase